MPPEWEEAEASTAKRKREGESQHKTASSAEAAGTVEGTGGNMTEGVSSDASEGLDSYMVQGLKALLAEAGGTGGAAAIRALVAAGVPVDGVHKQVLL